MTHHKSQLDLLALIDVTSRLSYKMDSTGVQMVYGQSDRGLINLQILEAAKEIAAIRQQPILNVMVNRLPTGIVVPKHKDFLEPTEYQPRYPTVERWHLPIITNVAATYWDERDPTFFLHMAAGYWWGPVPYWKLHQVSNGGRPDRVHLVVDLNTPEPQGSYDG